MRRLWLFGVCVSIALAGAACGGGDGAPTPTLDAYKMTRTAVAVLATNVKQTLEARATQSAMTPIVPAYISLTPTPTFTDIPTIYMTLTPTPTPTAVPFTAPPQWTTPDLLPAAPSPDTPIAPNQPAVLTLGSLFRLELDRAETRTRAGILSTAYGRFLVLFGTFSNVTDYTQCIYSRHIRLGYQNRRYVPSIEAMALVKGDYDIDYPGAFNGQCLGPRQSEATFILFDTPTSMTTFNFLYQDVSVGRLTLTAREDGAFDISLVSEGN